MQNYLSFDCLCRCSSDDQQNFKVFLDNLPADEHEHLYCPVTDTKHGNFLLVHQTKNQKRLMEKYGNELYLLDAAHKTSKYAIPLFFVVVPTNTSYQVVGSVLISRESSEAIGEALAELSRRNPAWKPAFWMTDNCATEINAIESVFAGKTLQFLVRNSGHVA